LDSLILEDINEWINCFAIDKDEVNDEKARSIVNRFASMYYNRSMVSKTAMIYRNFNTHFVQEADKHEDIIFSENYSVYNKDIQYVTKINDDPFWRLLVFNQTNSVYDKTNVINLRRHLLNINQAIPLIICRDPEQLNLLSIKEMGKQIDGNLYYLTMNKEDIQKFTGKQNFVMLSTDNKIVFSSNDPFEFVDWMKAQKPEQKVKPYNNNKTDQTSKPVFILQNVLNITTELNGYWPEDVLVSATEYNYTKESTYIGEKNPKLVRLNIIHNNKTIYQHTIISTNKNQTISLAADQNMIISSSFSDSLNTQYQRDKKYLYANLNKVLLHIKTIHEYPFSESDFIDSLKSRLLNTNKTINTTIQTNKNPIIASLLEYEYKLFQVKNTESNPEIDYDFFKEIMTLKSKDKILYSSPFYKEIIDEWLLLSLRSNKLKKGVDLLFSSSFWHPDSATSIVGDYIWKFMNQFGREDLMMHIDTTYMSTCSATNIDVAERLAGYKRMSPGNKAPNIRWKLENNNKELYTIKADSIYVVFWADWCTHCQNSLPEMYRRLEKQKNIKVLAINIDTDSSSQRLGRKKMPNWIHIQAKKGWQDKIVKDYNILGTPTIYQLDKNYKIISKRSSIH
jgi:thiol-disulfide isomerase/thioredoxin